MVDQRRQIKKGRRGKEGEEKHRVVGADECEVLRGRQGSGTTNMVKAAGEKRSAKNRKREDKEEKGEIGSGVKNGEKEVENPQAE